MGMVSEAEQEGQLKHLIHELADPYEGFIRLEVQKEQIVTSEAKKVKEFLKTHNM